METLTERIQRYLDYLLKHGIMPLVLSSCGIRVVEITKDTSRFAPLSGKERSQNAQLFSHYLQLNEVGKRQEAIVCAKSMKDDHPLYIINKSELQQPSAYEARFEQLQSMGYHEIFIQLFGVYEGILIFGVETGQKVPPHLIREGHITIVHIVGPDNRVVQSNWDAKLVMLLANN